MGAPGHGPCPHRLLATAASSFSFGRPRAASTCTPFTGHRDCVGELGPPLVDISQAPEVGQAWCWAPGNGVNEAEVVIIEPARWCIGQKQGSDGEELGRLRPSLPREEEASESLYLLDKGKSVCLWLHVGPTERS